jgi:hypothetical protein
VGAGDELVGMSVSQSAICCPILGPLHHFVKRKKKKEKEKEKAATRPIQANDGRSPTAE